MNRTMTAVAASFGLLIAGAPPVHGRTLGPEHDAVTNFTLKKNPNGPWTYYVGGHRADKALGSPVADYKQVPGLEAWTDGKTTKGAAYIARNTTTAKPLRFEGVVLHKNQLLMHGGGSFGVDLRFITPVKGIYRLKAELTGIDRQQQHNVEYAVYAKNREICSGEIQRYGYTQYCRFTFALKAGEIIDLVAASLYPGDKGEGAIGLIERIKGPIQKSK